MNKQSLRVDNKVTTECRSCLTTKNETEMRGRLCTWCLTNAGRSIHSLAYEDAIFQATCRDGRTLPKSSRYT